MLALRCQCSKLCPRSPCPHLPQVRVLTPHEVLVIYCHQVYVLRCSVPVFSLPEVTLVPRVLVPSSGVLTPHLLSVLHLPHGTVFSLPRVDCSHLLPILCSHLLSAKCSHPSQVPLFSPALGTSVHNSQVPVSSPLPDNRGPQILQIIDVSSVFPSNSRVSSCRQPGSWLLQATVVLSTPAKFFQLSQSTVVTAHQMAGVLASSCGNGSH